MRGSFGSRNWNRYNLNLFQIVGDFERVLNSGARPLYSRILWVSWGRFETCSVFRDYIRVGDNIVQPSGCFRSIGVTRNNWWVSLVSSGARLEGLIHVVSRLTTQNGSVSSYRYHHENRLNGPVPECCSSLLLWAQLSALSCPIRCLSY
jgi:hypothetical protein